jgi:hypothetical protein
MNLQIIDIIRRKPWHDPEEEGIHVANPFSIEVNIRIS